MANFEAACVLAVSGGDGFLERFKIDAVGFARQLAAGCEMDDLDDAFPTYS
ncbi:MAG: hypothetical protein ACLR8U_09540 [Oscillospiraceae bacterium]